MRVAKQQSRISFDAIITVFLRTFLATFGGAVLAYLLIVAGSYINILDGGVALFFFPVLCIGAGVWYVAHAKREFGDHWGIGASGILGIFAVLILLFFVLGTSS